MKVLVVYDTVSPLRMTAKVAEAISKALKDNGIEVDTFFVKDAGQVAIKSYDCLIVGSPTMQWRPTSGIMQFLESLPGEETSGKMAAAFDTQVQSRISGNATKRIADKLEKQGFRLIVSPLIAYVEGKMNQMQLKRRSWKKRIIGQMM